MKDTMVADSLRRPSMKVDHSMWTGYFINPHPLLPCSCQPMEAIQDRHDELLQKVRCLIQECRSNKEKLLEGMKLIDALERLGVGYHFYHDIAMYMDVLSSAKPAGDDELFTVALQFRLLRQHHYIVTCYVFKNFMGENGDFKLNLWFDANYAEALLSLYEAAQLGKPDEDSLRGAIDEEMHHEEVKSFSLWYKDLNPGKTLSGHIRERPVECYFWALGIFYEPHCAKARLTFARFVKMFSLFDDTFDSYGTMDELRRFNQAVQCWDVEGANQVGKCYGYVMSHLSEALEELDVNAGASRAGVHRTKEAIKEASRCMLQEVAWREGGQVPALHDYLKVSAVTTFYWPLACISFLGMDAADDIFTGAIPFPDKIIESAAVACRLMDDISGHECEKERSKCVTAVDCYVREHGVNVQQAKQALSCLVDEQWKVMNREFLADDAVPPQLLVRVMNLERLMESVYKDVDGYTHPEQIAGHIGMLLNECVDH
ncbi:hypothetical protein ACP4OV_013198 [Aristida adscensionis]